MRVWFPIIRANSGSDIFTIRLAASLKNRGIDAIVTWFPWYFEFAPFLLGLVPTPKVDVIHANSWNGFAFRRKNIPLIVTEHLAVLDPAYHQYKSAPQAIYHNLLIRFYETMSFRLSSGITSVSHYTAGISKSVFGLAEIEVIHNYLNMDKFTTGSEIDHDDATFNLLYVGNLSRRKGSDLLASIMEKLGPEYRLTIISKDTPDKSILDCENIQLAGPKYDTQLVSAYQKCDAVIFPTRLEGFGLVALEGMACGKPVITSKNSSLPELIEHRVSGVLCQTDNIDEYVAACQSLKNDTELYMNISKAARKRALSLFSEDMIIPEYINLYHKAIDSFARE